MDFAWNGFQWIDFRDVDNSIVSFLRRARDPNDFLMVVANFTPVPREGYRLGVPEGGFYRELPNSDSRYYGGGDIGNAGGVPSEPTPWQGLPHKEPESIAISGCSYGSLAGASRDNPGIP